VKPLMLPFFLALVVHAVLFQAELPFAGPVPLPPQSQSVSINLVAVQKRTVDPLPAHITPEPEPPPPGTQPPPDKPPVSKTPSPVKPYVSSLNTMAAIEPLTPLETVPEVPVQTQPSLPETVAATPQKAPAAPVQGSVSDHAEVMLSVPRYDLNPPFEYPRLAVRRRWEGTVILNVLVDENGAVDELNVARSSGRTLLDRNALAQVKNWRFEPARKDGRPIAMRVEVPVRYELK
jgi:protein TonB